MAIAFSAKNDDDCAIFDATLIAALSGVPENHRDPPPGAAIR
jgi:hypothetical protein